LAEESEIQILRFIKSEKKLGGVCFFKKKYTPLFFFRVLV